MALHEAAYKSQVTTMTTVATAAEEEATATMMTTTTVEEPSALVSGYKRGAPPMSYTSETVLAWPAGVASEALANRLRSGQFLSRLGSLRSRSLLARI